MKFQIKHLNSKWFHLIFLFHFGFAAEIEFPNDSLLNSKIMNESGDTLTVSNITNAKPSIIYFWATWCSTCKIDMKRTEKYLLSKVENINFVPIAYQDDLSKVIKSKNKMKIESSIYLDYTGKIFERQNIKATPTVMILNSNNEIIFSGFRPPREYAKIFNQLK
ncbi:MAG: TlpA family protein disulfide reductase [Candidatus Marinimicrobia bacterium]|nr:TlpA family protein disulfide reductase [Candidatus Neomarinimicrobiota bacterium]MBT3936300.1 TlpA family protein disulfide reductase [Candidatus Neomarinimicrobiota bacterium]MBT3962253.1 TlpA family protein disulfide reductase [Candidatus Neomarinimicrobiota bacterium]MBT4383340.1 TlpA family protein disulfide reductase [Candidatus Neomarinimicrobiota bacterium]MBT4635353.1 TlpA family protein disulfide reductase [Candidatus Neomarinimicrobiota bacterium]